MERRTLITAALPYSNDRLHLGHLRSTYIPADIYYRYLRKRGEDAVFICATDEHGTPIAVRAEREGVTPKEIADRYHVLIKDDLEGVGCAFSIFSRTTHPIHYETTRAFFLKLYEKGFIYEKEVEQLKCPRCDRFLPDRYVEGTCPYCGYEGARGDSCDYCGRYLRPTELRNPRCIVCGEKPVVAKSKHWFFKLSAFQEELLKWLSRNEKLPVNVKNYALKWASEGLKDWDITRDMEWGVPIPVEGGEGKVIYVWFDAPIGYISATKVWAEQIGDKERWRKYWGKEGGARIVHFIGKDIIYHHAIFWPAMLMAEGSFGLPYTIIAGEYLTLEGRKMSKSRGWVISVADYLKLLEPDPLRYYLVMAAPLDRDADFSWEEFVRRYNDELVDILSNFIHRTLTLLTRYFNGKVPKPPHLTEKDLEVLSSIKAAVDKVAENLENFKFRDGLLEVMKLAHLGNKYLNDTAPWSAIKSSPERAAASLYVAVQIVRALADLICPFMPFSAKRLYKMLKLKGEPENTPWEAAKEKLPPEHELGEVKPLFKKLKSEEGEKIRRSLLPREERQMAQVSLEEFYKAELRVGRIVEVKELGREHLYLVIKLGEVERSCVARIGGKYTREQLLGRQVVVVANIKPATIRGVRSEVMLLAAVHDGEVVLIVPEREVPEGSLVR